MNGPEPSSEPAREERLRVLLLDYEMAREDERTFNSIQAAMFGVAVALVAGLAALVTKACAFQSGAAGQQCTQVPEGVLVVTPLAPFALVLFILVLGLVATVRSYYLRALESELREFAGPPLGVLAPIKAGSYTELMSELVSLRRGERGYPFLVLMIVIAGLLIFGGFIVYIFSGIEWPGRLFMLILYGPAMLFVLLEAFEGTIGGRGLFNHVVDSYVSRMNRGEDATVPSRGSGEEEASDVQERSLTSYLILPRPEEVPKALFAPAVFIAACISLDSFSTGLLLRGAVVWFALEYLIYEARYQWNDVRGAGTDYLHRDQASRGRLPLGSHPPESTKAHMRLSMLVAGLRLALAPAIALTVGHDTWQPILALMVAVFAIAVPYEILRSVADASAIPRERKVRASEMIWALVGGGYLIRGVAGFCLAGYSLLEPVTGVAAMAFLSYGVMFVTMTWALEAAAHSRRGPAGEWEDRPDSPPRFHIGLLRRWLPPPEADPGNDLIHARPLRSARDFRAPWNLAFLCCGCLAGVLGTAILVEGEIDGVTIATGLVALSAAILIVWLSERGRWSIYAVGIAGICVVGTQVNPDIFYMAALPWILFVGLYLSFRGQSYESLKRWLPDIPSAVNKGTGKVFRILAGERTMEQLKDLDEVGVDR